MKVASLHIYPLKGGRGVDVREVSLDRIGLEGDRRWMVIDANARFVTQRTHPTLATLDASIEGDGLRLAAPDGASTLARPTSGRIDATIWRSEPSVALANDAANDFVSAHLNGDFRLVAFDASSSRRTNDNWADAAVSLADGYPVLTALTRSLVALNDDIVAAGGEPVGMDRFRPNIVIEGAPAWDDDGWGSIRVGDAVLDLVKPCDRCTVTQVEQGTGTRTGNEPLDTLKRVRRSADGRVPGVLFGWNAVPRSAARIAVGDAVEVIERRRPWPIRPAGEGSRAAF